MIEPVVTAIGAVVAVMIEPMVTAIGAVVAVVIEPVVTAIGVVVAVAVEPVVIARGVAIAIVIGMRNGVATIGKLIMPRVAYDSPQVLRMRIAVSAQGVQDLTKPRAGFLHRRDLVAAHRHPAVVPDFRRGERAGDRLLAR
jgi:hypothetical protein